MSAARPRRGVRALLAGVLGLLLLCLLPLGTASARPRIADPVGSDRFTPTRLYRGDFPDPSVLRYGSTYYAYSTTISGLNLPVVSSRDLVHWQAVGEGQQKAPSWSAAHATSDGSVATTWAPSVMRVGKVFVHAYATRMRGVYPRKMCISVSRSLHPGSAYVDASSRPLICPGGRGAIDPQYFVAPGGTATYLLWKSEQTNGFPAQLWATQVSHDGLRLAYPNHLLLTVSEPWEQGIIENPSMIAFHGRYYLFYSGGSYDDNSYSTGYAVCDTPVGPCTRMGTEPLLTTGGAVAGPGGAMAFYDSAMRLRMAYAAWDYGHTGYPHSAHCLRTPYGCNQRRLHVATLDADPDPAAVPGTLVVTARG